LKATRDQAREAKRTRDCDQPQALKPAIVSLTPSYGKQKALEIYSISRA
jgi:hypothetical protein